MRILIVGARGQLGTSLQKAWADQDVIALGRQDLDISDGARVREAVESLRPAVVVNSAAMRRPDACENEPERTFAINTLGARNLALACAGTGSTLLQISTDNVFDGEKATPYLEDDKPNPVTTYGISKFAAECFVRSLLKKYYVVRTSGLFGEVNASGEPTNFVLTMLGRARQRQECRVVTDQYISPTYTPDLARKLVWLITTEAYGTYHITNRGACSWYEFAEAIFDQAGLDAALVPTTTAALALRTRRLRYAVLGHGSLHSLGADDMPTWQDGLGRYLRALGFDNPATV